MNQSGRPKGSTFKFCYSCNKNNCSDRLCAYNPKFGRDYTDAKWVAKWNKIYQHKSHSRFDYSDRTQKKMNNSAKKQSRRGTKTKSGGAYNYVIPSHEPKKKHEVYYQECNICVDTLEPRMFLNMCYQCKEKICYECFYKLECSTGYCNHRMVYFRVCPFCRKPY